MVSKLVTNSGGGGEIVSLLTNEGTSLPVELVPDSGGGSETPLSTVLYVDGTSTATGTPNGSIGNPFLTLQAAVDASVDQGVIYVCWNAAGYNETVNTGEKSLQFIGIQIPNEGSIGTIGANEFDCAAGIALQNFTLNKINAVGQNVDLVDCNVNGGGSRQISCFNLTATSRHTASIGCPISCSGGAQLHNIDLSGSFDGPQFVASSDWSRDLNGPVLEGVVDATAAVSIQGMAIVSNVTGDTVHLNECDINAAITITATSGDSSAPIMRVENTRLGFPDLVVHFVASVESEVIEIDTASKQWLKNADLTTWGHVRILGALAQEQLAVIVPGVAAGEVGYVDVTPTGELANCIVGDVVVANPTADLVAAGAGGGYINCRVSATGTIRLAFVGPLAGGSSPFNFCRLSRAPFP